MELCFDIDIITIEPSLTLITTCAHSCSTLENLLKLSLYHAQSQLKPKYCRLRL